MKKTFFQLATITALMTIALAIAPVVKAQKTALPLTKYDELGAIPGIPEGTKSEDQLKFVVGRVLDVIKPILGAVAILFLIISGLRMVMANGETEVINKQKNVLTYAVIGLILVSVAGDVQKIFGFTAPEDAQMQDCPVNTTSEGQKFFLTPNQILCRVTLFNLRVEIIITFFKYILGSLAVFEIIMSAMRIMADTEDKIEQAKKNLYGGVIGLLMILMSNTVINKVFYKLNFTKAPTEGVKPGLDPARGLAEIAGFTNMVVSFVGPIAILVLLVAAVMYATAGGDQDKMNKARRMIFSAVLAIIIIYGAFAIVSTFVAREF